MDSIAAIYASDGAARSAKTKARCWAARPACGRSRRPRASAASHPITGTVDCWHQVWASVDEVIE